MKIGVTISPGSELKQNCRAKKRIKVEQQNWTSCHLATDVIKKLSRRLVHWSQWSYHKWLEKEHGSTIGIG